LFEAGNGIESDFVAARRHYSFAAKAGLPAGHFHLAFCMLEGWGGPVDRDEFVRELVVAGDAGYLPAQRLLFALFSMGLYVKRDHAAATRWLDLATAVGDRDAEFLKGQKFENRAARATLLNDLECARTWYSKSASGDYLAAMRAMSRNMLFSKAGADYDLSMRWLDLAIEGGDMEAPFTKACVLLLHPSAPLNALADAEGLLRLAAQRGNMDAGDTLRLRDRGRTLPDSVKFILNTSSTERYVELHKDATSAYDVAGAFKAPRLIHVFKPLYPISLRLMGVQGEAVVQFYVDEAGHVRSPTIHSSSHPLFADAAVVAILNSRFEPALSDGRPVRSGKMAMPFVFSISDEVVQGIDALLTDARDWILGSAKCVSGDADELSMARPETAVPVLVAPAGETVSSTASAVLLVVVGPDRRARRVEVLSCSHPALAEPTRLSVLSMRFIPRTVDNSPVLSNCVLLLGDISSRYPVLSLSAGR